MSRCRIAPGTVCATEHSRVFMWISSAGQEEARRIYLSSCYRQMRHDVSDLLPGCVRRDLGRKDSQRIPKPSVNIGAAHSVRAQHRAWGQWLNIICNFINNMEAPQKTAFPGCRWLTITPDSFIISHNWIYGSTSRMNAKRVSVVPQIQRPSDI